MFENQPVWSEGISFLGSNDLQAEFQNSIQCSLQSEDIKQIDK